MAVRYMPVAGAAGSDHRKGGMPELPSFVTAAQRVRTTYWMGETVVKS
jgi:hypothetical protein